MHTHTLPCHWCVVNEGCVVVSRSHPSRPFTQPHPMVYETAHVARKKTSGGWNINVYKMEGLIVHLIVWEHLCGILRVPIGFPKPPMEFPRGVHNASVTQHTLYIAQTMWCANYVSRILCRVEILRLHIFNCNDDNDMLSQNVTLFVHSVCNCDLNFLLRMFFARPTKVCMHIAREFNFFIVILNLRVENVVHGIVCSIHEVCGVNNIIW